MKVKSESEVFQSCPTLRDPMDCSLPGSSVHGIFQARVLEWGAIAFSSDGLLLSHKKGMKLSYFLAIMNKADMTIPIHIFGEGNGTPLQYSCLENPMDRGAWKAAVHGVAKSRT